MMKKAFTMAEILLSLTIIGVVAAITLPSLTGNINERTWNTQRKALYARMSQAIALMPALNGYGTLTEGNDSTSAVDTAAETFVTEGLSKVLKINNVCDSDHLEDCGITANVTALNGESAFGSANSFPMTLQQFNSMFDGVYTVNGSNWSYSQTDTKAAAFETQNGESIVVYYNPRCESNMEETQVHYSQAKMCANFVYDLNGNKGPNTVGKDIGFITAIYSSDPVVVAPMPLVKDAAKGTQYLAQNICKEQDTESRIPNIEELSSMFYNRQLLGVSSIQHGTYSSGTLVYDGTGNMAWGQSLNSGRRNPGERNFTGFNIRCIKR